MHRVVILQKSLPQYRKAFFFSLKEKLAENNITLDLIYGNTDENRKDKITIDWATYKKNKYFNLGTVKFIWQPCLTEIKSADLVIVEQADKLLINYVLFLRKRFGKQKFAFWGLGRHLQAKEKSPKNLFKRMFMRHCDWWFAYTEDVKAFLIKGKYPAEKITVVQNAIDTTQMQWEYGNIKEDELQLFRNKFNIKQDDKLLIYCGALFKEKRISFMVGAADKLVQAGHKIKLLVVGAGPDENSIIEAAKSRPYLIYAGPLFGRDKAIAFRLSTLFMLPGAIGLAVLDSFAFKTPIVTTEYIYHGAEFKYLKDGYNGIITENDLPAYVKGISDILNDNQKYDQLIANCAIDAKKYSNENMVENFAAGIIEFLEKRKAGAVKKNLPEGRPVIL